LAASHPGLPVDVMVEILDEAGVPLLGAPTADPTSGAQNPFLIGHSNIRFSANRMVQYGQCRS
jgi:hypothetical protein